MKKGARYIALTGIMAALLLAVQLGLSFLPNIELVSLLVALFAVCFGWQALPAVYVFAALEGVIFGFHIWWVTYLYVWLALFALARLLRRMTSALGWAVALGAYGLCFGALTSIPYFFISGPAGALSYFLAGIPFDLLHCGGNFLSGLLLWTPLYRAVTALQRRSGAAPAIER